MNRLQNWREFLFSDFGILLMIGLARFITLFITNGQTGWHRDELDTLENALYLDWGYVAYPPVAPFIARIALTLFGPSFIGVKFFSTLAHAISMVLAGLMARELGGKRMAQIIAAVSVGIAPYALLGGHLFHYSSFDFLWWVLIAYQMIRLLKSDDPRWWLGIGTVIGVGMMTKYAIAFLVAGIVFGVLATRARRHLLSPWLWGGVAISLLIFLPNLIWQFQHNFISLDFLGSIHERDVRQGRADGYVVEQFIFSTNLATIPVWIAGLFFYFFAKRGQNYRLLGWMYVIPFVLLLISRGRSYYLAPAYPMLFAGGAILVEQWRTSLPVFPARLAQGIMWGAFAISGIAFAFLALPIAPINSEAWNVASDINGELREMVGWQDLVETVAGIYVALPAEEKATAGILTGNYGELGAINLYGRAYGLPKAISGVNSYWLRGYGDSPPQPMIVVGYNLGEARYFMEACQIVGVNKNRYEVRNEESRDHPAILVCRGPREPWHKLWQYLKSYG